jgi:hypothetical protein
MSTRCQVKVIQEGMDWQEEITLYHHCDGYPEHMIPTIAKAFNYKAPRFTKRDYDSWEKGRAGKVASFLCWSDPGQFEPEVGHELHGDIEYYYKIYCVNHQNGSVADKPSWEIEIYKPVDGFWDKADEGHLILIIKRTGIATLLKKYPNKE